VPGVIRVTNSCCIVLTGITSHKKNVMSNRETCISHLST